ncbi:uncharacterized protein JCM15063_005370 [Sporobolomyces koalae]|uniref:uncharacterized protein n=1 Tax=Sporobolomyces koalae TaxID=500713 RepID=UPI003179D5FB
MDKLKQLFGYGFSQAQVPSLVGKTFVVTGGSNGIGLSISRTLYSHGAKVIIVGGQQQHIDGAVSYIQTGDLKFATESYSSGFGSQTDNSADGGSESGEVVAKLCELKDLKAVAELSKELVKELDGRLDGLFLIAGLGVNAFEQTKDGYDAHLTANSISQIVMLSHLLPLLEKTSKLPGTDVRIVSMSSELHRATFGGPGEKFGGTKFGSEEEFKQDIGPSNLYARSKLADILLIRRTVQLYLQPPSTVLAFATHPGAVATGQTRQYKDAYGDTAGAIMETIIRPLMRAPDDGALSALWAGTAPEARNNEKYDNGTYFSNPDQDGGETSEAKDQELIENFWNQSIKIIEKVAGSDALGPFSSSQA